MGSRERQDLLSKLGAWVPWERAEGEGSSYFKMTSSMCLTLKSYNFCHHHQLLNTETVYRYEYIFKPYPAEGWQCYQKSYKKS